MEIATVRAEIKSWERAFRSENSRNPTVEDIKANHKIAEKYKLYKKLCKTAAMSTTVSSNNHSNGPTTPPRRSSALPGPSSLLPKSRPVPEPTDTLTSNPFSPTKQRRRKQMSPNDAPLGMPNFMEAPSTPARKHGTSSSPKGLPTFDLVPEQPRASEYNVLNSAVKRAKKRLRGDIVSPSPKKRKTISTRYDQLDNDESDTACITDSPVKSKLNGKDFKPIFEDDRISVPDFLGKLSQSSLPQSQSIFNSNTRRSTATSESTTGSGRNKISEVHKPDIQEDQEDGKEALDAKKYPSDVPDDTGKSGPPYISRKRSSSADVEDASLHSDGDTAGLLPPSPPPLKGKETGNHNSIHKAANRNRKKVKVSMDVDPQDVEENDGDISVIEIDPILLTRRRCTTNDDDEDEESLMRETYGFIDATSKYEFTGLEENGQADEEVDIDLHDDLRQVLHISASRKHEREEQALVDSLLHGELRSRNEHGEVWGIGEVDDPAFTITDGEDDWAGEGVPWEVGEL